MAASSSEIRVFAEFPRDPQSSDWEWVHCLKFPVDTLRKLQFTTKPYKWVRYAIGIVVGVRGHLKLDRDSPSDVVDYDNDLPSQSVTLYYHTSEAEKARMFPADPDMNHEKVTSSACTPRRSSFYDGVKERDSVCVVLGDITDESVCDAAHLIAHSKGDEYIHNYTQRRSRDPAKSDVVDDIDDVRNGVFLNNPAHRNLGTNIAFLMTPNFAMTTADVDPTMSPTTKRCTPHLFLPDKLIYLGWTSAPPPGSSVRMPATTENWPPDILFDAVYAGAILRHFATPRLRKLLEGWKTTFYPRGTSAAEVDMQKIREKRDTQEAKRTRETSERDRRSEKHPRTDHLDSLMIMPFILMSPEGREAYLRNAAEKKAKMEQSRVEAKVSDWAEEVANASL